MQRYIFRILILATMWFPSSTMAQFASGGPSTLFGTLKITAKEGTMLPSGFYIVLYRVDKSIFGRYSVTNNGIYRFEKVPNGDYEIAIEAEGVDLVRVPYLMNSSIKNDERRFNLELEWKGKPNAPSGKAGTISAGDIYSRNAENATLMAQASAASDKKKFGDAVKLLKAIVASDPKDFEAWTELGTASFSQGIQGEAEKAFKRALEERPSYTPALSNLGKLNFEQKNYDSAIKVMSELISAHPESAEAHRFLGESYLRIKKGSLAVPELETAARLDPAGQADALLSLAALYDAAGLKERAAAEYGKFLVIKPDYPEKKNLEKYIRENKKF